MNDSLHKPVIPAIEDDKSRGNRSRKPTKGPVPNETPEQRTKREQLEASKKRVATKTSELNSLKRYYDNITSELDGIDWIESTLKSKGFPDAMA
eukprot:4991481-Pyramimonas_sp.AAC.1